MRTRQLQGPARYLAEHRVVRALSALGAAGAAVAMGVRAARAHGLRRLGWASLALLELGIALSVLSLRRRREG
jgi:hypothetical protein